MRPGQVWFRKKHPGPITLLAVAGPPALAFPAAAVLATRMPINRLERFAHNLDWNLLRTFVVVVEEGSITRAANRLLLQQPAVSMALKRLEQSVGHRLIDHSPGRFELTRT